MSFDASEVFDFARDLGDVPRQVIPNVRKAVEFSAREGKDAWRDAARSASGSHARRYPGAVDYEMVLDQDGSIGADIGPNLDRTQGALGFLEDAPGGVNAAPQRARVKVAKVVERELEKGLLKAVDDSLGS